MGIDRNAFEVNDSSTLELVIKHWQILMVRRSCPQNILRTLASWYASVDIASHGNDIRSISQTLFPPGVLYLLLWVLCNQGMTEISVVPSYTKVTGSHGKYLCGQRRGNPRKCRAQSSRLRMEYHPLWLPAYKRWLYECGRGLMTIHTYIVSEDKETRSTYATGSSRKCSHADANKYINERPWRCFSQSCSCYKHRIHLWWSGLYTDAQIRLFDSIDSIRIVTKEDG